MNQLIRSILISNPTSSNSENYDLIFERLIHYRTLLKLGLYETYKIISTDQSFDT